jgi:hypothetical protein
MIGAAKLFLRLIVLALCFNGVHSPGASIDSIINNIGELTLGGTVQVAGNLFTTSKHMTDGLAYLMSKGIDHGQSNLIPLLTKYSGVQKNVTYQNILNTDSEFDYTALGKINKLLSLLSYIKASNTLNTDTKRFPSTVVIGDLLTYSAATSKTNSILGMIYFMGNRSIDCTASNLGTQSTDDEGTSYTFFGRLNALLDVIRKIPIQTSTGTNFALQVNAPEGSDAEKNNTLYALTQIGSRGFSPSLVDAIHDINGTTVTATSVLKDSAWDVIWGTASDTADPIGSLTAQWEHVKNQCLDDNVKSDIGNKFTNIRAKFSKISDSKLVELYSYAVPIANYVRLDRLDAAVVTDMVNTSENLSIQECVACLLAGALSDIQKAALFAQISVCCDSMLGCFKSACCNDLYDELKKTTDELYKSGQVARIFALDPINTAQVWKPLLDTTDIKGALEDLNEFNQTEMAPEVSCRGADLANKISPLAAALSTMNNALYRTAVVPASVEAAPEKAEEYCAAIHAMLTNTIPGHLDRIKVEFESMYSWFKNLTDEAIHLGAMENVLTVLGKLKNMFPETISFSAFCNTAYENDPENACKQLDNIYAINTSIAGIVSAIEASEAEVREIIARINHQALVEIVAARISAIDRSMFHFAHALADSQLADIRDTSLSALTRINSILAAFASGGPILAALTPLGAPPPVEPDEDPQAGLYDLLSLSTAFNALTEELTYSVAEEYAPIRIGTCPPCSVIANAITLGIPTSLERILNTIGEINANVIITTPEALFDEGLTEQKKLDRLDKLRILAALLENFANIIPTDIDFTQFCDMTDDYTDCNTENGCNSLNINNILALLTLIKNTAHAGKLQLDALIYDVDHALHCTPHDDVHRNILRTIHHLTLCTNEIFRSHDAFAKFDMWDGDSNRMVNVLNAIQSALNAYPELTSPIYENDITAFDEFLAKLGAGADLLRTFLDSAPVDDPWTDPPDTESLWAAIISEIAALSESIHAGVDVIASQRDCVIPVLFTALTGLAEAINSTIQKCQHPMCAHYSANPLIDDATAEFAPAALCANLINLAALFKDNCNANKVDYCRNTAKYLTELYRILTEGNIPTNVNSLLTTIVGRCGDELRNNKNVWGYLNKVIKALTGSTTLANQLPDIDHRYGICAQLLEMIGKIASLVPTMHEEIQFLIMTNGLELVDAEKLNALISHIRNDVIPTFKDKNCETCNQDNWRFGSVETQFTQLADALAALDLSPFILAKNMIIPFAHSLASIHSSIKKIAEAEEPSISKESILEFAAKVARLNSETMAPNDAINLLRDAFSILTEPTEEQLLPIYTSDIYNFIHELNAVIVQTFDEIVRDSKLCREYGHYRPDVIMALRTMVNALPYLQEILMQFASIAGTEELARRSTAEIEGHLQTWLSALEEPSPCVVAVNNMVHRYLVFISNFLDDPTSWPSFPPAAITSGNTLDFLTTITETLPETDAPLTPLPATLARLLNAISQIPEKIFSLATQGASMPGWIANLKEFQQNALLFLQALRQTKLTQCCEAYDEAILMIKLYPLERLNFDISAAIVDLEHSVHTCSLIERIGQIHGLAASLPSRAKSLLRTVGETGYIARLQNCLRPISTGSLDTIEDVLEFLDQILCASAEPNAPDKLQEKLSPEHMLYEIIGHIKTVAQCFAALASEDALKGADLGSTFRFIAQQLPTNPILEVAWCDICALEVNTFAKYFMAAINNIRESCLNAAALCDDCPACKDLVPAIFALEHVTRVLTEYSAEFPQYGDMDEVVAQLNKIQIPENAISCGATEYIETLCGALDAIAAKLFGASVRNDDIIMPEGDDCQLLEVACTRIYANVEKIVERLHEILYNAQAPPTDQWRSAKGFSEALSKFADVVSAVFSNITFCKSCNHIAFTEIFSKITERIAALKDFSARLNEQWNQFEDYADNTEFLIVLHNFCNVNAQIHTYITGTATIDELLAKIDNWNKFISSYTTISALTKDNPFLQTIGYEWETPAFWSPTSAFILEQTGETAYIVNQNILTFQYIQDFFNENITELTTQTLELIARIKPWRNVWQQFMEKFSQEQEGTPSKILVTIPLTEAYQKVVDLIDEIIDSLNAKPSKCHKRVLKLKATEQVLHALADANTLDKICGAVGQVQWLANVPEEEGGSAPQNCVNAEIMLQRINDMLRIINANLLKIDRETDWEQVSNSDTARTNLLALYDAIIAIPLEAQPCDLCNPVLEYAAQREAIVSQILVNVSSIYDRLAYLADRPKAAALSVISTFCEDLATYFCSPWQTSEQAPLAQAPWNLHELSILVNVLNQIGMSEWLAGDFSVLHGKLNDARSIISIANAAHPEFAPFGWYYDSICESLGNIHRALILARETLAYEPNLVGVIHKISKCAAGLRAKLRGAKEHAILNWLDNIAMEGDLWTYVEPVPDNTAILQAYQRMESIAKNLQKIDDYLKGPWGGMPDLPTPDRNTTGLEQMFEAANSLADVFTSQHAQCTSSHESCAVLATRYNFWLEQAINTLDSIIQKIEENHTVAIPDAARQYVLQFLPLDTLQSEDPEVMLIASLPHTVRLNQQISRLADTLLGRNCAVEAHFYGELAPEFQKIAKFFEELVDHVLETPIANADAIIAHIRSIEAIPYAKHTIQPSFLASIKALADLFGTTADPTVKTPYNYEGKTLELGKIQEYVEKMNQQMCLLAQKLGDLSFEYDPDLVEFFGALRSLGQIWRTSLPSKGSSLLCQTLENFDDALQRVIDTLSEPRCCIELAGKMLTLLRTLEGVQVRVSDQIKSKIQSSSSFDDFLEELRTIFEKIEAHTHNFDSVFALIDEFASSAIPSQNYDLAPCDTLEFVFHKVGEVIQKFSGSFNDLLNHWGATPPTYAGTVYENIVKLLKLVFDIRDNLQTMQSFGHFSSCRTCSLPQTDLCRLLHGQNLTNLASYYLTLESVEKAEKQLQLATVLQSLAHAVASCDPQMEVEVNGTMYPIGDTTKAENFIRTWTYGLQQIDQAYSTAVLPSAITQFAKDIRTEHTHLGGTLSPTPAALISVKDSAIIGDFVSEICTYVRNWFRFAHSRLQHEAGIATAQFCDKFARYFRSASFSSQYSLMKETRWQIASQLQELAEYLNNLSYTQRCCAGNNAASVCKAFEELTMEMSQFVQTLGSDTQDFATKTQELSTSIGALANKLAAIQLAPQPELLCVDHSQIISQCATAIAQVTGKVHAMSSGPAATASGIYDAIPNEALLARILYFLRDAPFSLVNSLQKIDLYATNSTQAPYELPQVQNLRQIKQQLQSVQQNLQALIPAFNTMCAPFELGLQVGEMVQVFDTIAVTMDRLIEHVRLRMWTPFAAKVRTLREAFSAHTYYLQKLAESNDSTALKDENYDDSYRMLVESLGKIKDVFKNIGLLATSTDIGPDEVQQALEECNAFIDAFAGSTVSAELGKILQIFSTENVAVPDSSDSVEMSSFDSINADFVRIYEDIQNQVEYIQAMQMFETGYGSVDTQALLQEIATITGTSSNFHQTIFNLFRAYSLLSSRFYEDAQTPIADYSSSATTALTSVSSKIHDLAAIFEIEKCHVLIDTYATKLPIQLQRLKYALEQVIASAGVDFNWKLLSSTTSDSVVTFISDIIRWIISLRNHIPAYFLKLPNSLPDDPKYCEAQIIAVYVEQICETLDAMNTHLYAGVFPEFTAIALPEGGDYDASLAHVRAENLKYLDGVAGLLKSALHYVMANGPIAKENLDKLCDVQDALQGLAAAFPGVSDVIRVMCTIRQGKDDSRNFIAEVMECIYSAYRNLVEITDLLKTFCCNSETEMALIGVAEGTSAFVRQLKEAPFDPPTLNCIAPIAVLIDMLPDAISLYLAADAHAKLDALNAIASLFPVNTILPLTPFDESAKDAYICKILDNISEVSRVFLLWSTTLQETSFPDMPKAICILSELMNKLSAIPELFANTDLSKSFLHDPMRVEEIRAQIRQRLEQMYDAIACLRTTYLSHDAEDAVRAEVAKTQQIFAALPKILNVVLKRIEGVPENAIEKDIPLPLYLPQTLGELPVPQLQAEWQSVFAGPTSFTNICAAIAAINQCLYSYAVDILQSNGKSQEPTVLPVSVLLTNIEYDFQNLHKALANIASAVKCIEFNEELVLDLVRENGPLMLLYQAKGPLSSFASHIYQYSAYESSEWALILRNFDAVFVKIFATILEIKDAVQMQRDAQALSVQRKLLNHVHRLSTAMSQIPAASTLAQAKMFFEQLRHFLPQIQPPNQIGAKIEDQQVDALLEIIRTCFAISGPLEPIIDSDTRYSFEDVQHEMHYEVSYIENVLNGLIPLWLTTPYKLEPKLIDDVSAVQALLRLFPVDLSYAHDSLQRFLDCLKAPTFCMERNTILSEIEASIATMLNAVDAISQHVHFLEDGQSILQIVQPLPDQIQLIASKLGALMNCEEAQYVNELREFAMAVNGVTGQLVSLASVFGGTAANVAPTQPDSCEYADIFLTRIATHISKIQARFLELIDNVQPIIGKVMPLRTELIMALRGQLASTMNSLHDRLSKFATRPTCELHNRVAQDALVEKVTQQCAIMTAYPQCLADRLEQFKSSALGHTVHVLRQNMENIQAFLSKTILNEGEVIDWNNDMLPLAAEQFNTINQLLTANGLAWREIQADTQVINFIASLNIDKYVDALEQIFAAIGYALPARQAIVEVTYCEDQIAEDLGMVKQSMRIIFDVVLPQLCKNLIEKRLHCPALAGVFRTLGTFCYAPNDEILCSILPTLDSTMLRQLEFMLSNTTCCELFTDKIAQILVSYAAIKGDLHRMSASVIATPSGEILGKAAHINSMVSALQQLSALVQSVETDELMRQMECAHSDVCFSEHAGRLLAVLGNISDQMASIKSCTAQVACTHCVLNDLSLGHSEDAFSRFDENLRKSNVFYNDGIAAAWEALNTALTEQAYSLHKIGAILKSSPICLWRGQEFLNQFDEFEDFNDYIQYSKAALAAYKELSLVRSSMQLYRIHQQLQPLVMIEQILLRNATIEQANTCMTEIYSALQNIKSVFFGLNGNAAHSLQYLHDLSRIEGFIRAIATTLREYAPTKIEATFDPSIIFTNDDFLSYFGAIVDDLGTLQTSLGSLRATLASEDGTTQNERCHTDVFSLITTTLNEMQFDEAETEFASSAAFGSPALLDKDALKNCFQQLGARISDLCSAIEQIDQLAQDPTCCYVRQKQQAELYKELDGINQAILKAVQSLRLFEFTSDYAPLAANVNTAIASLQSLRANLCDISPDPDFACQAKMITAQTCDTILPAIHIISQALALALERISAPAPSGRDLTRYETSDCPATIAGNQALGNLAAEITESLQQLRVRLSEVDLFAYDQTFVDTLKSFLVELLFSHARLEQFCESFAVKSCNTCSEVSYAPFLQNLLQGIHVFEDIVHIIESNRPKQYSKTLHTLANVVDTFVKHTSNLFLAGDISNVQKLSDAVMTIAHAATNASGTEQFIEILNSTTEHVIRTLFDLQLDTTSPIYPEPTYGQTLIDIDRDRLAFAFKTLITVANAMPVNQNNVVIIYAWESLAEATHQLAISFYSRQSYIANEVFALAESLKEFVSRLRETAYCKPVDEMIEKFTGFIVNLGSAFNASKASFIRNLTSDESAIFAERLAGVTTQISNFVAGLPSIKKITSSYFCSANIATLNELLEQLDLIQNATIDALRVFDTSLPAPQQYIVTGLSKPVAMKRIVQGLHALQQSMSDAWKQAQRCQVRDYHQNTINALKTLKYAFNTAISQIGKLFDITNICQACERKEIQLIFNEIPPILTEISVGLADIMKYLEKTCCSRLGFQTYTIAKKTNVLSQHLTSLSNKSAEDLVQFFSNKDLQMHANSLTSVMTAVLPNTDYKLLEWSKLAELFTRTGIHCSALELESYLDHWSNFLGLAINTFNLHCPRNDEGTIGDEPQIYDCKVLPDMVALCVQSISAMASSLANINERLQGSVFKYSEVFDVYMLLFHFSEALDEFDKVDLSTPGVFCSQCETENMFTQILTDQGEPFSALKTQICELMNTLTTYCNQEFIERWNYFSFCIQRINNALENFSVTHFWDTLKDANIKDVLSRLTLMCTTAQKSEEKDLNNCLQAILEVTSPNEQVCAMAKIVPYMNSFAAQVDNVTEAVLSIVGQTNSPVYQAPMPNNDALPGTLATIADSLQRLIGKVKNISDDISNNQRTADISVSSFFASIGEFLQQQQAVLHAIYEKWETMLPCSKMSDCTICKKCDNCLTERPQSCMCAPNTSTRYNIWQIGKQLGELADKMKLISQIIAPDCCKDAFEYLFVAPKQSRAVQYNVRDILAWDGIFEWRDGECNNLVEFVKILRDKLEPTCQALNSIFAKREQIIKIDSNDNCYMSNFKDIFRELNNALETLSNATAGFISVRGITQGTRQQIESPSNYACKELFSVLPAINDEISNIKSHFEGVMARIPVDPIISAINPLIALYNLLQKISSCVDQLTIPDGKRQICRNCSKEDINAKLNQIKLTVIGWADAVINIKNAFLSKYCCKKFGKSLAKTSYIISKIQANSALISDYQFKQIDIYHDIWSPQLTRIADSIYLVNRQIARFLSVRRSLAQADPVVFCSIDALCTPLDDLNDELKGGVLTALQNFVSHLGFTPVLLEAQEFEEEICTSFAEYLAQISESTGALFEQISNIFKQIASLQLTRSPALMLEDVLGALSETSSHLYELYLDTVNKQICMNCDYHEQIKDIQTQCARVVGAITDIHLYLHDKQYVSAANALAAFLQAYGTFTSTLDSLHLAQGIDSFMNDPMYPNFGEFRDLVDCWNRGFMQLKSTGMLHGAENEYALTESLNVLGEMTTMTRTFLLNAVGGDIAKVPSPALIISPRYATDAATMFNQLSGNAAEALVWFSEHCEYLNVKAHDANTFSLIAEFATRACPDIFAQAVAQLRDTLSPQKRQIGEELNHLAMTLDNAANDLCFEPSHIEYAEAYKTEIQQLFIQLQKFAPWILQLSQSDDMSEILKASPMDEISPITLRIRQQFDMPANAPITKHTGNTAQAIRTLSISVQAFSSGIFNFVNKVASFHIQHRIELNMYDIANVKTAIYIVKRELSKLQKKFSPELPITALIDSIDSSLHTFSQTASILTHVQATVRTKILHDELDAFTCDENGIPVINRLVAPIYDEHGMPTLFSQSGSIISITGAHMDDVTNLHLRVFNDTPNSQHV